jgi:hypothetical protein
LIRKYPASATYSTIEHAVQILDALNLRLRTQAAIGPFPPFPVAQRHPELPEGVRRTMERRIRQLRALNGRFCAP